MPNSHFVVGNRYHVMAYKNINTEEMYHDAGMILKMSLVSIHLDELKTYFNAINKIYNSCDQAIDLKTIDQLGQCTFLVWLLPTNLNSSSFRGCRINYQR